jgi:hypothetical protein
MSIFMPTRKRVASPFHAPLKYNALSCALRPRFMPHAIRGQDAVDQIEIAAFNDRVTPIKYGNLVRWANKQRKNPVSSMHVGLRASVLSASQGWVRLFEMIRFPATSIVWARISGAADAIAKHEVLGTHFPLQYKLEIQKSEFQAAYAKAFPKFGGDSFLFKSDDDAPEGSVVLDAISSESPVRIGIESLMGNAFIIAMTNFEMFAGDLLEAAIGSYPAKFPASFSKPVSYSNRWKIRKPYHEAFNDTKIDTILADQAIDAFYAVRNVIAHNAGFADDAYIADQKLGPSAPLLAKGDQLPLDGDLVIKLLQPIFLATHRLVDAVDNWLSKP